MIRRRIQEGSQGESAGSAGEMYEQMLSWRRNEAGTSFGEIMEWVRTVCAALMKPLVE